MRLVTIFLLSLVCLPVQSSDHLDSEYIDNFPASDIGDLFVWSGENNNPVFMISLNPLTMGTQPKDRLLLDPEVLYEFKIDLNGDALADLAYQVSVSGDSHPQKLLIHRASGESARQNRVSNSMPIVAKGLTSIPGKKINTVIGKDDIKLFAGARQDPFFFNFKGILSPVALDLRFALSADGLPSSGTAADTFGPTNITGLILQVPELKGKSFGVWSTTSKNGKQLDRCGRSSITAIFLPNPPLGRNQQYYPYNVNTSNSDNISNNPKQVYNTTRPYKDRELYSGIFKQRLRQLEVDESQLDEMVNFFLPDILGYEPNKKLVYPNGRNLEEDAVYWTINKINPFMHASDPENPLPQRNMQKGLSDVFPYAAPPVGF